MRLSEVDYLLTKPPTAVVTISFTDENGKSTSKDHPVAMPTTVADSTGFETVFMPEVMAFSNVLAAEYALLSEANVDVSVTFTNPFALANANIGEWGGGDTLKVASLSVYLETAKTATILIPAPVQTIFLANTGPNRNVIDVSSATAGLLTALLDAYSGIPGTQPDGGLMHLSDGERIDDTLGYNGLRGGKKITRKNSPKVVI